MDKTDSLKWFSLERRARCWSVVVMFSLSISFTKGVVEVSDGPGDNASDIGSDRTAR